jgi:uncharacterized membrane protein
MVKAYQCSWLGTPLSCHAFGGKVVTIWCLQNQSKLFDLAICTKMNVNKLIELSMLFSLSYLLCFMWWNFSTWQNFMHRKICGKVVAKNTMLVLGHVDTKYPWLQTHFTWRKMIQVIWKKMKINLTT